MFVLMGAILYTTDFLGQIYAIANHESKTQDTVLWLGLEILIFYLQIYSVVIYFFYLQCKNQHDETNTRFQSDMLDFFQVDVNWFTLLFMMFVLHVENIIMEWIFFGGDIFKFLICSGNNIIMLLSRIA